MLIFAVIFFVITNYGLKKYTLHNNNINVPNLKGLTLEEVDDTLMSINLNYVIIDSDGDSVTFDNVQERGGITTYSTAYAVEGIDDDGDGTNEKFKIVINCSNLNKNFCENVTL